MKAVKARGFSLLELIIAISVQAILVLILAFAGGDVLNDIQGPKGQRAQKDAAMISMGLWGLNEDANGYVGDNGLNAAGLAGLTISTSLASPGAARPAAQLLGVTGGWNGPYIGVSMNALAGDFDPWENKWRINSNGTVQSAGPDGVFNTNDDIGGFNGISAFKDTSGMMNNGTELGTLAIEVVDQFGVPLTHNGNCSNQWNFEVSVSNPTPEGPASMQTIIVPCQTANPAMPAYFVGPANLAGALWPGQHAVQVRGLPQQTSEPLSVCDYTSEWLTYTIPAWGAARPMNTVFGVVLNLVAGGGNAWIAAPGTAINGALPIQGLHSNTCAINCATNPAFCSKSGAAAPNETSLGLYGHAIGYVIGGGSSTVSVTVR